MAPTYFRREPGIERSDGLGGSALLPLRRPHGYQRRMGESSSTLAEKAALRDAALARRDALPAAERAAAAQAVAARGLPVGLAPGMVVSGFSPMRSEINPVPLMRRLADQGASLALPVVQGRGRPLAFRAWTFGDRLVPGVWGIREPSAEAPTVEPDLLLVPLAAFDRRGFRLGYGGGYYDRTLAALRGLKTIAAVGLAFAAQEIARVPDMPYDARLDFVLTELEAIDCRGA
jgi:5-formyltetrahydrofolate cyclo-ligase